MGRHFVLLRVVVASADRAQLPVVRCLRVRYSQREHRLQRALFALPVDVREELNSVAGAPACQTIRLASGSAGNRVEFFTNIDWKGKECALKAVFPLTVSNPQATYNWELGTVSRGNNDPKKYEVPSHKCFDLTDTSGSYGVSILDDCKYGSDKPSDNTVRLTLLYTPGTRGGYQHQGTPDWGKQVMTYAVEG